MPLRGFIFDFDGTLADTWSVYDSAFNKVMQSFLGREMPYEERMKNKGADEIDFVRNIVPASPDEAAKLFVSEFRKAHLKCIEPYPEIRPLLDGLSLAGARLGVVSAKAHESGGIAFEMIPIRHYFDPVVTGTGWSGGKAPNISNVVAAWGFDPSEVAYIGDSQNDMVDARMAGVHAVGVAWAGMPFAVSTPAQLQDAGAAVVFTVPRQLTAWVKSRLV